MSSGTVIGTQSLISVALGFWPVRVALSMKGLDLIRFELIPVFVCVCVL